jgi:glycosyltransferase involved in cell wall biosynthesis
MISYSVIIPAYNEEALLADTIAESRRGMDELLPIAGEIIVVDNNSVDRTPKIAVASGARVVFEPVNQISRARNAGAREAKGKYFFFIPTSQCQVSTTPTSPALLGELKLLGW